MEWENFYSASYNGTKNFKQQDVYTANASGFGAAADDFAERGIDLNEQLIYNKSATIFYRMNGESMTEAGISNGDILIVDRSIKPTNGKIIVASVNGDLIVRRFTKGIKGITLIAENPRYAEMEVGEFTEYRCYGIVTCVIHVFETGLIDTPPPLRNKKKIH